ncbi:hypothetical protein D7030_09020 [Flavobacteriaceae bacterium AU392]|nr:hypothetical protein D1817_15025 [Flavobacteriaceae bacterium]RKM84155.1 hypothetical protein D7030_09020 [Flavobacteriaceae bacterium AU392]
MNSLKRIITILLLSIVSIYYVNSQNTTSSVSFKNRIQELFPTAKIKALETKDHFKQVYQVIIKQLLDHSNPESGTFEHYIYMSHSDYNQPTVLVTEGYNARYRTYELSKLLKSNQIMVEYRFYGASRPDPIPWQYLTNDQAIEDYHLLVLKLKSLYKNKWISTGISKGGETVLIYKSKYPKDIDVAIPYVAPLINTQEDPRTTAHINSVGSAECRTKVKQFQRALLLNREALIEEINIHAKKNQIQFNEVSIEEALEYAALEFSFSFWQWGGNCDEIPSENASPKELFDYMNKIVGIQFYSDKTYFNLLPSFYQHIRELGYYGFDFSPVEDLLKVVKSSSNTRFAPKNVDLTYNPNYIKKVRKYVERKGDHILYIYGEYDTWRACAPNPKPKVDALKMVLKGGHHGTRIRHFSKKEQQKIYNKLQTWLGKEIRLYPL